MFVRFFSIFLIICSFFFLLQCTTETKPSLVVYISIDQMRYDYLERFMPYFTSSGYNLLLEKGANFRNCNYEHYCTYTGPGHACLGTSCYAGKSGIVGNSWYVKNDDVSVYCVDDLTYFNPNDPEDKSGAKSAERLLISTLGDEMKNKNEKSKVYSVSGKDRAAILMSGKKADAAFWYRKKDGHFITSNYYLAEVPDWANKFNNNNFAQAYLNREWTKLLPEKEYEKNCTIDDYPAETDVDIMGRTFPHKFNANQDSISNEFYTNILISPIGDSLAIEFAKELIINENMGMDDVPDLLCLGLSCTDYVGHPYGPDSHEMMDLQIRLDGFLNNFFLFLDTKIGLQKVVIVITADHGVAQIPELLKEQGIDAGRINSSDIKKATEGRLQEKYGSPGEDKSWIASWGNASIYLSNEFWEKTKANPEEVYNILKEGLLGVEGITAAYSRLDIKNSNEGEYIDFVKKAFDDEKSGDVIFIQKPNWIFGKSGTTHGSPFEYDTHVPMLFFGANVTPGNYDEKVGAADIAISIGKLVGVDLPGLRDGESVISYFIK